MARYNPDWDELGRAVQEIVDRAVTSHDYEKMSRSIRQTVEQAVDLGSDAVRKAKQAQPVKAVKDPPPVLYANTTSKVISGVLKAAGGGVLTAVSAAALLSLTVLNAITGGIGAIAAMLPLACLGGGGFLLGSGVRILGRMNRFKTYRTTLGQKTNCSLEKLAGSVGKSVKFVRREVAGMIEEGLFLEGHLDKEERNLITSHETYRYFEQSRLQLEQRKQEEAKKQAAQQALDPQVQEVLNKGEAFVAQIRKCNDEIPGVEISEKISRMEHIVQRIFDRAEQDPSVIPELKKLMDYYLPMTVKLLRAYADMDAQPVQGETILASKREIEETLDTLNLAFEKLLDELFEETALDISSDISVLQTLLAQEGLVENEIDQLRKQRS